MNIKCLKDPCLIEFHRKMMRKEFNKLVRDKMIDIYKDDVTHRISASGYNVKYLSKDEIHTHFKNKLIEEVSEVCEVYDKDKEKLKEELADVIEVIDAILHHNNSSFSEVLEIRNKKKDQRGGFIDGLYLEYIDYL